MGRKELLAWMVAASTVNYVGRIAISVAGPDIAKQYNFSEAQLGQIFAAFWFGYGVMMWPSGWLADRYGAARVLGLCGLASAVLLAGQPALPILAGFFALRLLFGVASAALYPACGTLTALAFRNDQFAGVQGAVVGGSNLGAALTPFLIVLLSRWAGWQGAFLTVAAGTAVFFVFWLFRVSGKHPAPPRPPERLRFSTPFLLLTLQQFCISYFYSFGDSWSFYYFREVRHFPEDQAALFTTLLQIAGGIAMPLGGWLADIIAPRFGRLTPALTALAASGLFLAASVRATSPVAVLALITASYSLVVMCEGVYWWAVLTACADSPGSGFGFANTIGAVAQFIAPLSLPWIAARWGWDSSVYSVVLALALAALCWRTALSKTYSARWLPSQSSS